MKKFRISLWMYGLQVIRSEPIDGERADFRMACWRDVFGQNADIKIESVQS